MEGISSESDAPLAAGRAEALHTLTDLARRTEVRVLKAGGSVYAHHGLISPLLARSVSFIVDPAGRHALVGAFLAAGWALELPRKGRALPPALLRLRHPDLEYVVQLHSIIPGFFVDPARAFATMWSRRDVMVESGERLDILDRLVTVLFAAHDRLDGRRRARVPGGYFDYFLEQFRAALGATERSQLLRLAIELGAQDEFRELLEALGVAPDAAAEPSRPYARERLALDAVRPGDLWLLERYELSPRASVRAVGMGERAGALRRAASAEVRIAAAYGAGAA